MSTTRKQNNSHFYTPRKKKARIADVPIPAPIQEKQQQVSYEFPVWEGNQFDFERIVNEVKKDTPNAVGFFLTSTRCYNAVLVLFIEFTSKFLPEDQFIINNEIVCASWGTEEIVSVDKNPFFGLKSDSPLSNDYAVSFFIVDEMPQIMFELQLAKKYLNALEHGQKHYVTNKKKFKESDRKVVRIRPI